MQSKIKVKETKFILPQNTQYSNSDARLQSQRSSLSLTNESQYKLNNENQSQVKAETDIENIVK